MKKSLLIDSHATTDICLDGPSIVIRTHKHSAQRFPFRRLCRILCIGMPSSGLPAFAESVKRGIPVTFVSKSGHILAQLTHPENSSKFSLSDWLEAIEYESELMLVYQTWRQHQLKCLYSKLSCWCCDEQHAAHKAKEQLDKLARRNKMSQIVNKSSPWLQTLIRCDLQKQLSALGLYYNVRYREILSDDLLHPLWVTAMTEMVLTRNSAEVIHYDSWVSYYEKEIKDFIVHEAHIRYGQLASQLTRWAYGEKQ